MPSNEFRTLKRKEWEKEEGEREKHGEEKGRQRGERKSSFVETILMPGIVSFIPFSSDFWLLFNGLELVTPIFQSYI